MAVQSHTYELRGFQGDFFPTSLCGVLVFDSVSRLLLLLRRHLFHTLFHTPSFQHNFVTQNFVTRPLSHTIFHTPSFTYHLSHTIFHTPSFTRHLSHTSLTHHHLHHLSHTIFHILSLTHHLSSFTDHLLHTATLCVARVALDDIHLRFAWQAWHLWH